MRICIIPQGRALPEQGRGTLTEHITQERNPWRHLQNFLEWLGGYVWGTLLILLGGTAVYLSFRLLFLRSTCCPWR